MRAAVLRKVGEAVAIEDLTLRPLGPRDVRVRLAASGVCHTDLSIRDGALPSLLPCTLGHEGAGVVVEVGGEATTAIGTHVVLSWNVPCRACHVCLRGQPYLCARGLDHAFGPPYAESADGPVWPEMGAATMAEESVLPEAAVVPIDPRLPLDLAALLGCGVATGVGAAGRTAGITSGDTVLVVGCGGVGLAAIQGARLAGAARIIAADRVDGQLENARVSGATDTINSTGVDLASVVRDLTDGVGVDHALEVVGKRETITAAYTAARRGGQVTLVGAGRADESVGFPVLSLMADGKTVSGSVYGATDPIRDIPVLADLALRGRLNLQVMVSRRITLDQVEDAFASMAVGDGARSVIVFDPQ
jgi:S-(hydroxymethyl)glutathione dehydrogenase/alcohol dehydrogenase